MESNAIFKLVILQFLSRSAMLERDLCIGEGTVCPSLCPPREDKMFIGSCCFYRAMRIHSADYAVRLSARHIPALCRNGWTLSSNFFHRRLATPS